MTLNTILWNKNIGGGL